MADDMRMFDTDEVVEFPPDAYAYPGPDEVNHLGAMALLHLVVAQVIVEGPAWHTHVVPFRLNPLGIRMVRMLLDKDAIRKGPHWEKFVETNPELRQESHDG